MSASSAHDRTNPLRTEPRWWAIGWRIALTLLWGLSVWSLATLALDRRTAGIKIIGVIAFVVLVAAIFRFNPGSGKKTAASLLLNVAIMGWWFTLRPSGRGDWAVDVSRLPWAERSGDRVTLHDVRNFSYRTESDYDARWETRIVDLSAIVGADLFVTHWGVPLVAHSIVSFRFRDGSYLATSIEARKTKGRSYSAMRGFFRQFEIIYLVADERDVVRLRTNYRKGEEVYMYRTRLTPADSRRLFEAYLGWMDRARTHPDWYNAVTANCATDMISFLSREKIGGLSRWDLRGLLAGDGDKMLYDLGDLAGSEVPFDELKRQAHINAVARAADSAPDFSGRIRAGRPGFE
ncbi:MAG: hypothetical protein JWM32_2774 [Verrucomicrobia bacterium]|nr:hypothetical protein [Verrucomicrobiota bacterium]